MLDDINNVLEYERFIYTFCTNAGSKTVFKIESKPGYDMDSDLKELFHEFCIPLVTNNFSLMYGISTQDNEAIHRRIVEIGTRDKVSVGT